MNDDILRRLGAQERDSADTLDEPTDSLDPAELRRLQEVAHAAFAGATPIPRRSASKVLGGLLAIAAAVLLWILVPHSTPRYALEVQVVQAAQSRGPSCTSCAPSTAAGFDAVLRRVDGDNLPRTALVYTRDKGRYRQVPLTVEQWEDGSMRVRGAIESETELVFVVAPAETSTDDVPGWIDSPEQAPTWLVVLRWSPP